MGHGAWGIGHGAWGMEHGAWGIGHTSPRLRIAIYGALRFVIVTANQAGAVLIAPTILLDLSRVLLYCDRTERRNLVVYTKTFLQPFVLV